MNRRPHVLAALTVVALLAAPFAASLALPGPATSTRVEPALLDLLAEGPAEVPVIVQFDSVDALLDFAPRVESRPVLPLRSAVGLAFSATPAEVVGFAGAPGVRRVSHDAPLPVLMPTATLATQAQAVWGAQLGGPLRGPDGEVIDGTGVGVAVIDTGIDATNPALADRVVANYKVVGPRQITMDLYRIFFGDLLAEQVDGAVPEYFAPVADADVGGGHGTHVAGIVAANGDRGVRGAAPGASLYGFGTGAGLSIITSSAVASFDWIIAHHDQVDPPIRIITNSYGSAGAHNPDSAIALATSRAADAGLVVVFAAGNGDTLNEGGDGSDDRTTGHSKHPAPGVISVANYDDQDAGTRDGILAPSSSRGLATDATTWPDLAAPGSGILSTMAKGDPLGVAFLPIYGGGEKEVVESEGNVFGNAINQWTGDVKFVLDGRESAPGRLENILPTRPAVIYNAHRDDYASGADDGGLFSVSPFAARDLRFFGPVSQPVGPLAPESSAAVRVSAGDRLVLTKEGGTAEMLSILLVAPDGQARELVVPSTCEAGCESVIDLHALFPGAPADGTWAISVDRTARPENADGAVDARYTVNSGTSMAAPHVAGVIALMLQANPALTAAQVESILESTAYKFADGAAYEPDPLHPGTTSSFDKGHGLVDAKAAVEAALALR